MQKGHTCQNYNLTREAWPAHPQLPSVQVEGQVSQRRRMADGEGGGSYSVLRACIGEIAAARPAGIIAATKAQMPNAVAAIVSASGSQNDTP